MIVLETKFSKSIRLCYDSDSNFFASNERQRDISLKIDSKDKKIGRASCRERV